MKLYLAGPMRGLLEYNFPAFERATSALRGQGHEVLSPHELDLDENWDAKTDAALSLREYMVRDLPELLSCQAIALLPGWYRSEGATLEHHVATTCGLDVFHVEPSTQDRLVPDAPCPITEEAWRIVYGRGESEYGHPRDNFAQTGEMLSGLLRRKLKPECEIDAEDVGRIQIVVKLSRDTNKSKRDNLVDIAGYAATIDRVRGEA